MIRNTTHIKVEDKTKILRNFLSLKSGGIVEDVQYLISKLSITEHWKYI